MGPSCKFWEGSSRVDQGVPDLNTHQHVASHWALWLSWLCAQAPSWLAWFVVALPVALVGNLACWGLLLAAYRPGKVLKEVRRLPDTSVRALPTTGYSHVPPMPNYPIGTCNIPCLSVLIALLSPPELLKVAHSLCTAGPLPVALCEGVACSEQ